MVCLLFVPSVAQLADRDSAPPSGVRTEAVVRATICLSLSPGPGLLSAVTSYLDEDDRFKYECHQGRLENVTRQHGSRHSVEG